MNVTFYSSFLQIYYFAVNAPDSPGQSEYYFHSVHFPPSGGTFRRTGIVAFLLFLFLFHAALNVLMSLYAAHCVVAGGMEIGSIESVGGKTLEEGYYQELATVYAGYAAMIRATGIFFSSILAYIWLKN